MITIVGLKPETFYEVKMSAINGKGEGESSPPQNFKTEPVRKCLPPSLFPPAPSLLPCPSCRATALT
jgi:neurocan core protein